MKKITGILMIVGAVLAFASCCHCTRIGGSGGSLIDSSWQLMQIEGRMVNPDGDSFTLNFAADNTVSGKGDCNRLSGTYQSDKDTGKLTFGPMASTRMMCPNQAQEDVFVRLVNTIDSYKIEKNLLLLFSNGELKMVFDSKK